MVVLVRSRAARAMVAKVSVVESLRGPDTHVESSSSVFVCVAALAILDRLDLVDTPTLAWWISERQLPNGGLNGRPEKLEDVSRCTLVLGHLYSSTPPRYVIRGGTFRRSQFWANFIGSIVMSSLASS
jgi:hypothetical protein